MNVAKFEEGVRHFNSGRFHEAHDVWEELWLAHSPSPEKDLLKGLIMAAAALHHYKRREFAGTVKLVARSTEILRGKGISTKIDVEGLLADLALFAKKIGSSEISEEEFPKIRDLEEKRD